MLKEIIFVLLLQLLYVPALTLRTIFMVRNMTLIASFCGAIEALIYVLGLALVLNGEQTYVGMVVYALGFGLGIFVGGYVERKLAIGYVCLCVNIMVKNDKLVEKLRNQGFGVTVFEVEGRDSRRYRLDILAKRSREEELIEYIEEYEPKAFIISYEPKKFIGGFLSNIMKKQKKIN